MRVGRQIIVPLPLLALLVAACVKEGERRPVRPKATQSKESPDPPALPRVTAPKPVAAERVVDLFYTSNVAGEADPCG